jgi:phosphoglycerate-specific signal transduction histidine kinase
MQLTLAKATVDSSADYIRNSTLRGVRHFLSAPDLPVYRDLKRLCERVSDSYRDRVVLELLQNAHDAHAPDASDGRIKLWLDPHDGPFGALMVANGGYGFDRNNFEKLCSPGDTTKIVNEAIGN